MSLYLTSEEIFELSGYVQPSKQIKWLAKNGIRHFVRRDGRVRVVRSDLAQRQAPPTVTTGPNFAALAQRS